MPSSLICLQLALTSFSPVFTRSCLVIPIRVVTHLLMRHTDALGIAATIVVCLSSALLGSLTEVQFVVATSAISSAVSCQLVLLGLVMQLAGLLVQPKCLGLVGQLARLLVQLKFPGLVRFWRGSTLVILAESLA